MEQQESFASRLAAGTATASKMASWWPRHVHATSEYLGLRAGGSDEAQAKGAREVLLSIAKDWESSVPCAARKRAGVSCGLMVEHATLETLFVEAALGADAAAIDRIATRMLTNAKAHGARYGHAIKGFPESRFSELLREHISLFIEAVTLRIDRNASGAVRCTKKAEENAVAIAMIAAEWL